MEKFTENLSTNTVEIKKDEILGSWSDENLINFINEIEYNFDGCGSKCASIDYEIVRRNLLHLLSPCSFLRLSTNEAYKDSPLYPIIRNELKRRNDIIRSGSIKY